MGFRASLILASLVFLVAVLVTGCGGGDGGGGQDGPSEPPSAATESSGGPGGGQGGSSSEGDSGQEAADAVEQVRVPKELAERFGRFGDEASVEEQEQILEVFVPWRAAMAAEDWEASCTYLQASLREDVEPPQIPENLADEFGGQIQVPEDFPKTCTERLARAAENPGPERLDSRLRLGTVGVSDDGAFILYKARSERAYETGSKGAGWFLIGLVREDDEWKLASAQPLPVS